MHFKMVTMANFMLGIFYHITSTTTKKQKGDPCWRDPGTGSMMKTKKQDRAENQMTGCKFI